MPKTFLVTLAAAALIVTGCAAPSESSEDDAQPVAETETPGAGAEEFASLIAETRRDVDEWLDTWDENGCSSLGVSTGTDIMACEMSLISGGLIADTAEIRMEGATKEGVPAYIGQPPENISIIWDSTKAAAAAASDAGEEIPDDCAASDECAGAVMNFLMAMDDLQGKYDAWEPYM